MAYGLNIFDINENFKSLYLRTKGVATFVNKIATIPKNYDDIVVLSNTNGQVALYYSTLTEVKLITENATQVSYMLFNYNVVKTKGLGLQVYNTSGQVVFSSDLKFLKPYKNVNTHINRNTFIENIPSGKQLGVILANFGFNFHFDTGQGYAKNRSVHITNNAVTFGFVNNNYSGKAPTGMRYITENIYFNALLVDITNY